MEPWNPFPDETRDARALTEAAEQAAAAGDFVAAARHLRGVVARQERELGPSHPDLANTLNNLGVVLERASQHADAEAAYRRAYAIAREAFPADHPFVATSEANLREFCATRGVPFDIAPPQPPQPPPSQPPPVPVAPAPPVEPAPIRIPAARPARQTTPVTSVSVGPRRRRSPVAAGIGLGVVVAVVIGWAITRPSPTDPQSSAAPASVGGAAVAPEPETAPATTSKPSPGRATPPAPVGSGRGDGAGRGARAGSSSRVEVVRADVCRTLSTRSSVSPDWPCETAGDTVRPGTLSFYTRLRSPVATTVEHRWYRGQTLEQRVELRVAANAVTGYRTYSRHTIGADRAGEWRVELRNEDNVLLHEERFTVRVR